MTLAQAQSFAITNNISFTDACAFLGLGLINQAAVPVSTCALVVTNIAVNTTVTVTDCVEINVLNASGADLVTVAGATLPTGKSITLKAIPGKVIASVEIVTGTTGTALYSTIKN